jgi:predicted nucleic acid-binding protein
MNAVDTNILIYRLDHDEPSKRGKARLLLPQLLAGPAETVLLWQVAGEFVRHLRKLEDDRQITRSVLHRYLGAYRRMFRLIMPTPAVLDRALYLSDRFSLSRWDSMLLGACLEAASRLCTPKTWVRRPATMGCN